MLLNHVETMDLTPLLEDFAQQGYAELGGVLSEEGALSLAARAQGLMQSPDPAPGIFYQHDSPTGLYEDLKFNAGWVGPSPHYRKLEKLELDPLFLAWIENPLFERISKALLGDHVSLYRAVLWNKAPRAGMPVPWHQDDGRFWGLDRAPSLQVWTALDDAPEEAGCLEVVPGSHLRGLASKEGGTISKELLDDAGAESLRKLLPARRGDCILVHNHLWHRTGTNHRASPRRAISVSFLDAATGCKRRRRAPRRFRRLFDES